MRFDRFRVSPSDCARIVVIVGLTLGCAPEPPVNLLIVTVDTLRADRLGAYGYTGATSPYLDAWVRKSVLFENASTVLPRTTPALASLFTGLHPHEHGLVEVGERLPDDVPTLAEILRDAGYRTGGISANPAARSVQALDRGFEDFAGPGLLRKQHGLRESGRGGPAKVPAKIVTDHALQWLETGDDRPWFLWLLYVDPHWPYRPPAPHDQVVDWSSFRYYVESRSFAPRLPTIFYNLNGRSEAAREDLSLLYDAEIRYLDSMVARLLDWVGARPDAGRTLIVFTSDHGESLGDHGYYYEHGELAYQATMRVPLIFHRPGALSAPRRIRGAASLVDVAPTVLSLLGLDPGVTRFAGRDLSGWITGVEEESASEQDARIVLGESGSVFYPNNPIRPVGGWRSGVRVDPFRYGREGDWVVVERAEGTTLYDASVDPALREDLSQREPDRTADMLARLQEIPVLATRWRTARDARFELIRIPELSGVRYELYDLLDDPGETHNLIDHAPPKRVARLREALDAWLAEMPETIPVEPLEPEQRREVEEALRALGYAE